MKTAKTSGFRWLPSFYNALRNLPDEDRLKIYDAILDFGFGNEPEELPPLLTGYYQLIRPIVEKSARFYDKQKENGSKGGRKPKHIHIRGKRWYVFARNKTIAKLRSETRTEDNNAKTVTVRFVDCTDSMAK